ncbi:hypothetical protein D3C80_1357210 [compost metagenome]
MLSSRWAMHSSYSTISSGTLIIRLTAALNVGCLIVDNADAKPSLSSCVASTTSVSNFSSFARWMSCVKAFLALLPVTLSCRTSMNIPAGAFLQHRSTCDELSIRLYEL